MANNTEQVPNEQLPSGSTSPENAQKLEAETSAPTIDDSGLRCLMMLAQFHGIVADKAKIQHEFGADPLNSTKMMLAAKSLGFSVKLVKHPLDRLSKAPMPCAAIDNEGRFFILTRVIEEGEAEIGPQTSDNIDESADKTRIMMQRPGEMPQYFSRDAFSQIWSGELIYFTSKASFLEEASHFDFTWFIPAIVKYRKLLGEVLLLSLVLQLIGLLTPMFFQVVMDKVLVNHAIQTLHVIAVGLLCAIVFEVLLTGIRTYVFSHTSSKIDVELGARLFRHLMALPMGYFQSRRVGDSVARIRELENIRSFLTGNSITLILDLLFSFVFIAVMLWYSAWLTLIVVCSIPLYVLISTVFTPMLRARLKEKFNRGALNQAFLVETISGIGTIKAMAVEPRWQQKWDKQLAGYVSSALSATNVGTIASNSVTFISKLVTLGIMWMGAKLVIDEQLTVGELIAFNMLATQVSNPILRMAQLWNDFQQVGISMSRLGDILNARTEIEGSKTRIPQLTGAIEFDQVSFRYRPDTPDVIRSLQFAIRPGEVIGIVGRSGSGKSTLAKLVQRMYVPDRGRVLVDGQDISIIDTASLRQQIGVVLQENILFNSSVRDNIAMVNPTAPIEVIIAAAKLAGAHEFICELPEGYDTVVGEHGSSLSGGQRQRIAIARALISNPRILIFDEATSALDYESEKIIQDNMRQICKGRTVLIIAHRLSAVRDANRIIVMDRGQIVEVGRHEELVRKAGGIYAHLYQLQLGETQNPKPAAPQSAPQQGAQPPAKRPQQPANVAFAPAGVVTPAVRNVAPDASSTTASPNQAGTNDQEQQS